MYERHRHRYEVNNRYRAKLEEMGLVCSGTSPDDRLVEFVELPSHPFFVATQAHPEFKSRPDRPHPLFAAFVHAALRPGRGSAAQAAAPASRRGDGELAAASRTARGSVTFEIVGSTTVCEAGFLDRRPGRRARARRRRCSSGTSCAIRARWWSCRSTDDGARAHGAPVPRRDRARRCSRSPRANATSTARHPRPPRSRELEEEIGYRAGRLHRCASSTTHPASPTSTPTCSSPPSSSPPPCAAVSAEEAAMTIETGAARRTSTR